MVTGDEIRAALMDAFGSAMISGTRSVGVMEHIAVGLFTMLAETFP